MSGALEEEDPFTYDLISEESGTHSELVPVAPDTATFHRWDILSTRSYANVVINEYAVAGDEAAER